MLLLVLVLLLVPVLLLVLTALPQEDVSSGPLLFDLAVAVIGCCFRDSDNELDLGLLTALLTSYAARRYGSLLQL